jgi:hypothetical protein
VGPHADLPTIVIPLGPRPRREKGESKKKSWDEDAGEAAVLPVDQVAVECIGVSSADQVWECEESVTSEWDALGRKSGMARGSAVDGMLRSRKGSRFCCVERVSETMCLIGSG